MKLIDCINKIPDKVVADDIRNYFNDNDEPYKHLFYHIKSELYPNYLIEFMTDENIIYLYTGGCGHGYYLDITYDFQEKMYIFSTICGKDRNIQYKNENWNNIYKFINNYYKWYKSSSIENKLLSKL